MGEDEILTLSHSARGRGLFAKGAVVAARWVAGRPPAQHAAAAKTRYRQSDAACEITPGHGSFSLRFEQAQWAVTPGQSAVVYQGEVCLGGGVIN